MYCGDEGVGIQARNSSVNFGAAYIINLTYVKIKRT